MSSGKQKTRKEPRRSRKTADRGTTKEALQPDNVNEKAVGEIVLGSSVPPPAITDEDRSQDDGFAVPCSQKIVPTFKKKKALAQNRCQDDNDIPRKRLKRTVSKKEEPVHSIVTTVQIHRQDSSMATQPADNTSGTCGKSTADQNDSGQTPIVDVAQPNIPKKNESLTEKKCDMAVLAQEVQGKPIEEIPSMEVPEQEESRHNNMTQPCRNPSSFSQPEESPSELDAGKGTNSTEQLSTVNSDVQYICGDSLTGKSVEGDLTEEEQNDAARCEGVLTEEEQSDVARCEGVLTEEEQSDAARCEGVLTEEEQSDVARCAGVLTEEEQSDAARCEGVLTEEEQSDVARCEGVLTEEEQSDAARCEGVLTEEEQSDVARCEGVLTEEEQSDAARCEGVLTEEEQSDVARCEGVLTEEEQSDVARCEGVLTEEEQSDVARCEGVLTEEEQSDAARCEGVQIEEVVADQVSCCDGIPKRSDFNTLSEITTEKKTADLDQTSSEQNPKFYNNMEGQVGKENQPFLNNADPATDQQLTPVSMATDQLITNPVSMATDQQPTNPVSMATDQQLTPVSMATDQQHTISLPSATDKQPTTLVSSKTDKRLTLSTVPSLRFLITEVIERNKIQEDLSIQNKCVVMTNKSVSDNMEKPLCSEGDQETCTSPTKTADVSQATSTKPSEDMEASHSVYPPLPDHTKGTTEENAVVEDLTDSQLCAMDWSEEAIGPTGDYRQKEMPKVPELSLPPDGTGIVRGLIRELSQLNMMILRAKREMQTSKQRAAQSNDPRVSKWTDK